MKDVMEYGLKVSLSLACFGIVIALLCIFLDFRYYEYIDTNNKKGIAKYCDYRLMTCTLEDGTSIKVKEFKAKNRW